MRNAGWLVWAALPAIAYLARQTSTAARRTRNGTSRADGRRTSFYRRVSNLGETEATMSKLVALDAAMAILTAARRKAEDLGVAMNIAIVDDGGNLVAFARMDGAWLGSIEIAQNKAWTARAFDISTKELASMSQPKQPLFGIAETHRGRVIIFAGGVPLRNKDQIVGAIGVSGGTPDQDHQVAEAGATGFEPFIGRAMHA